MRIVFVDIYKRLDNLWKKIFQLTETERRFHNAQKLNLKIPRVNQVTGDFRKPKKV